MPHKTQRIACKKALFLTKKSAERAFAKIINSDDKRLNTPIRFYPCDFCRGYHLTSKERPPEAKNYLKYLDEWYELINVLKVSEND